MTFDGLPLHPLVVHAVVILVPLGAVVGIAYAAMPKWRAVLRWPLLLLGVFAAAATWLAAQSGEDLAGAMNVSQIPALAEKVEVHEEWAERLAIATYVMGGVWVLAFWVLGFKSTFKNGRDRTSASPALEWPVRILLAVVGLAVLFLAFQTGHSGASAVWDGVGGA